MQHLTAHEWTKKKNTHTHTIKQTIIQIRDEKNLRQHSFSEWETETRNDESKRETETEKQEKYIRNEKKNNINTHKQCRKDKWCTGSWHLWWPQFYRRMNTSVFGLIASMRFILYDAHKTTTFNIYIDVYKCIKTEMAEIVNVAIIINVIVPSISNFRRLLLNPISRTLYIYARYTLNTVSTHCACLIWCKYKNIIFSSIKTYRSTKVARWEPYMDTIFMGYTKCYVLKAYVVICIEREREIERESKKKYVNAQNLAIQSNRKIVALFFCGVVNSTTLGKKKHSCV